MEITIWLYLWCYVAFILGQAIQLFWIKIPSLRAKSAVANKPFYIKEWWACDWNIIIGTQLFGLLAMILFNELFAWAPQSYGFIKTISGLTGAFGTSVALAKWGQFEKGIMNVMSVKANTFELLGGGVSHTLDETIKKGIELTGQDVTKNPEVK